MAKAKRWVVRREGGYYVLSAGFKPYKSPLRHWVTPDRSSQWFPGAVFEAIFPEYYLAPGGGPVEIRFADEARTKPNRCPGL